MDYFATIDAGKLRTANTLGLKNTHHDTGGEDTETLLDSIGFGAFMGIGNEDYRNYDYGGDYRWLENEKQCVPGFVEKYRARYERALAAGDAEDMTPEEYLNAILPKEFRADKEVDIWTGLAGTVLDVLIVGLVWSAITGEDLITGNHLTDNERQGKALDAAVRLASLGITIFTAPAGEVLNIVLAALIADMASGGTYYLAIKTGLPPVVSAILAILAGIIAGSLASELLRPRISDEVQEILDKGAKGVSYTDEEIGLIRDEMAKGLKNNPLRQAYESEVKDLARQSDELLKQGLSEEEVARTMYQARRDLGVKYKDMTPEPLRDYIYARNISTYEDPLGPPWDYLIDNNKTYRDIIESSARPNTEIDKALAGFEEWLRRQ